MLEPNTQCESLRRWDLERGGHKSVTLMNGISSFGKKKKKLTGAIFGHIMVQQQKADLQQTLDLLWP